MGQPANASRLDEHIRRALKPAQAQQREEITEVLDRDLGPGDKPFQLREVSTWLRNAGDRVMQLYWPGSLSASQLDRTLEISGGAPCPFRKF